MTTSNQIDAVREMCAALEKLPEVKSAAVDDWGRYGNFQVLVVPEVHDRYTTNRLKGLIRQNLPKGAHLRSVFGPDPITEKTWNNKRRIIGYSRKYWVVDVDYQAYDPATNSFAA